MRIITLGALFVLLAPVAARGQEIPCSAGPCLRRPPRGTHFLAEVNGGTSISGRAGLEVGGLVGAGGKLRWLPLPFYLISEFAYATGAIDHATPGSGLALHDSRAYRDLALGLRTYVPIHGPLRLFVDLMGGATHVSAALDREGFSSVQSTEWHGLGQVAAGLQLRLFHHLSIGLRAKVSLSDDGLADLREVLGMPGFVRTSATAGLTCHF